MCIGITIRCRTVCELRQRTRHTATVAEVTRKDQSLTAQLPVTVMHAFFLYRLQTHTETSITSS
jgi:hypothetical protein